MCGYVYGSLIILPNTHSPYFIPTCLWSYSYFGVLFRELFVVVVESFFITSLGFIGSSWMYFVTWLYKYFYIYFLFFFYFDLIVYTTSWKSFHISTLGSTMFLMNSGFSSHSSICFIYSKSLLLFSLTVAPFLVIPLLLSISFHFFFFLLFGWPIVYI